MSISSLQLDAFNEVAKYLSFSKAAQSLAITQSALSQRVKNLEVDLAVTLFIRDTAGIKLTEFGLKLHRYSQMKNSLEDDFLNELRSKNKNEFVGIVRIAGFSSVLRSVIIPALADFLRKNSKIQFEFIKGEIFELPNLLRSGEADFVISDERFNKSDIVEESLGTEEYVVIESLKHQSQADVFLDHGPADNATETYFNFQAKKPKKYRRVFMGDVYGILDGVSEGLGRAVMSKHLIHKKCAVKMIKGYKKYEKEVTLHYYNQPFYPAIFTAIKDELLKNCSNYLKSNGV